MNKDITFGKERTETYIRDAKKIAIDSCRYKFCARILDGKKDVLEVGCNQGLFTPIVAQTVDNIIAIDINKTAVYIPVSRYTMYNNIVVSNNLIIVVIFILSPISQNMLSLPVLYQVTVCPYYLDYPC